MPRHDNRSPDQLRPVSIQRHFTKNPGGSVLISFGETRVLCTAMIEKGVPDWMKGKGNGWATAEYGMLPGSTLTRKRRDSGKPDGRSVEIQRLVGRCLRAVIDLKQLGENTLWLDCDVIQADGGTRTASITGAYVALVDAVNTAKTKGLIPAAANPVTAQVSAISVGIVAGKPVLDLDYKEDVDAHVDMNVAMLNNQTFVEVQGTGEHATFSTKQLHELLTLAQSGIQSLHKLQLAALKRK